MPNHPRHTYLRRTFSCAAVAGAVVLTGACSDDGGGAFERSEADVVVEVTLADFAFKGLPASVSAGNVFFATTNAGPSDHELEVLGADGKPVDEIEAHPSGQSKTMALRLAPGTYTVQCILKTAEGRTHAELGMTAPLRVQ